MNEKDRTLTNGLTIVDTQTGLTPVELYTQTCRITGWLASGGIRISDVLNQVDRSFLTVEKATITHFGDAKGPIEVAKVQINRSSIVLAVPRETKPTEPAGIERPTMHVQKQRHRVVIEAGPVSVDGFIHLVKEAKVDDALLSVKSEFIPLTCATITVSGATEESFKVEAAIISRTSIQLMYGVSAPAYSAQPSKLLIRRTG